MTEEEVRQRYAYRDFPEFIDAFKWVTSFLREPQHYALIARDLADHFLTQNAIYKEHSISLMREKVPLEPPDTPCSVKGMSCVSEGPRVKTAREPIANAAHSPASAAAGT